MIVELTNKIGTRLPTAGCIFKEDLTIIPKLPSGGGGGAELNIAYGDTPPEDTTKLWCKCSEPSGVHIGYGLPTQEVATVAEGSDGVKISELAVTLPQALRDSSAVAVGNKIYVFGGQTTGSSDSRVTTIYRIDTENLSCTRVSSSLTASVGIACVTVDKKIYLFGGGTKGASYSKDIYCFDVKNEALSKKGTMAYERSHIGAAMVGDKIYLFGGKKSGTSTERTNIITCYDLTTNVDTLLPTSLPATLEKPMTVVKGTDIFIMGGIDDSDSTDKIYCYNTQSGKITTIDKVLPYKSYQSKLVMIDDNHGFIVGYQNMLSFNLATMEFGELMDLPSRSAFASTNIESKIYRVGGTVDNVAVDTIQCIEIEGEMNVALENGLLAIVQSQGGTVFPLVATDTTHIQIGIYKVYKGNADGVGEKVETALYKDGAWATI
jgi:hypothetical protein